MFNVGDIVMVTHQSLSEPVKCKILDFGEDEKGIVWYECTPLEFHFPREFTKDCLTKI